MISATRAIQSTKYDFPLIFHGNFIVYSLQYIIY